jgi:uncharacterized protein YfbU (UPF0304 family)
MIPDSLSIVERQILTNQFRILSKMESNPEEYETKIEILENGYTEQYYEIFDVNTEEIPLEVCEETSQILNMYRRINNCIKQLSEEEKTELNLDTVAFEGFDSRTGFHFQYMTFMVEKMNLWREYRSQYLNTNDKFQLTKYRKMLDYQNFLLDNDQYDIAKTDLRKLIAIVEKETLPMVK